MQKITNKQYYSQHKILPKFRQITILKYSVLKNIKTLQIVLKFLLDTIKNKFLKHLYLQKYLILLITNNQIRYYTILYIDQKINKKLKK